MNFLQLGATPGLWNRAVLKESNLYCKMHFHLLKYCLQIPETSDEVCLLRFNAQQLLLTAIILLSFLPDIYNVPQTHYQWPALKH